MIRSIFAKILLWNVGMLIGCLIAFLLTSMVLMNTSHADDGVVRSIDLELENARRIYETGGREQLARELARLPHYFPGQYFLTDARGLDLADGQDRSRLLAEARHRRMLPLPLQRFVLVRASADKRYRFVVVGSLRSDVWKILPFYCWILLGVAFVCYLLAIRVAAPLRQLCHTLDRFGAGELSVRTHSRRQDQFGSVSRAFDQMADRIETLLVAERRLLQDISHELRTPLARLGFIVELARTSPDREASYARAKKEIGRLSQLIDELLELTRIEGDPLSRHNETVRMDELLRDIADACSLEAQTRSVAIEIRDELGVAVQGDAELLRRAVENIVRNAVRFAPEDTAVTLELRQDRDRVTVCVCDRGPGVPDEHLQDIFRPFFRVDAARSSSTGGVGLGLSIAERAIRLHQGTVRAQNAKPGLAVRIELPCAISPTSNGRMEHGAIFPTPGDHC